MGPISKIWTRKTPPSSKLEPIFEDARAQLHAQNEGIFEEARASSKSSGHLRRGLGVTPKPTGSIGKPLCERAFRGLAGSATCCDPPILIYPHYRRDPFDSHSLIPVASFLRNEAIARGLAAIVICGFYEFRITAPVRSAVTIHLVMEAPCGCKALTDRAVAGANCPGRPRGNRLEWSFTREHPRRV
jgi:hypothetical protein